MYGGIGTTTVRDGGGKPTTSYQVLGDVFELSLTSRDWREMVAAGPLPLPRCVVSLRLCLWLVVSSC